ncbi:MAG: hypothetical protein FWC81_01170 [Coriobacteriia bacterium]|nr:hypothetical protein [Coriobacteriia bacterium]
MPDIASELPAIVSLNFLYGLSSAIILSILYKGVRKIYFGFRNRSLFSASGYWIGEYTSSIDETFTAVDILYLRQRGNKVLVKFQQYRQEPILDYTHHVWYGEGYISDRGRMAISYFTTIEEGYQNGVFLLTQTDFGSIRKAMSGVFYEFHDNRKIEDFTRVAQEVPKSQILAFPTKYRAYRLRLSVREKVLFRLNKAVYASYSISKSIMDERGELDL